MSAAYNTPPSETAHTDHRMMLAALEYYGFTENYQRVYQPKEWPPRKDGNGKPLNSQAPQVTNGRLDTSRPVWIQANIVDDCLPAWKRSEITDIVVVQNVTLDAEYPSNPSAAHNIGLELAQRLVEMGIAQEGQAVEDTGAGFHIVLACVPIHVEKHGGAEVVNDAINNIVNTTIKPTFEEIAERHGLRGKIKLEGLDIARLISIPGTIRPSASKPDDALHLHKPYLRRWLPPYESERPRRKENRALSALIVSNCTRIRTELALIEKKRVELRSVHTVTHSLDPRAWLQDYVAAHALSDDESSAFQSLVNATYLRFDENTVLQYDEDICALSGAKYSREKRLDTEIARSLRKAVSLLAAKKTTYADWLKNNADNWRKNEGFEVVLPESKEEVIQLEPAPKPIEPRIEEHYNLTDTGNFQRFVAQHGHDIRYVQGWGWQWWNGKRWAIDETGVIMRKARETVLSIYSEAARCEDEGRRKKLVAWALQSEARKNMVAFVKLGEDLVWGGTVATDYDADLMLFNCQNGTIDLRTGALRTHDRADLITKISPVTYDTKTMCPIWTDFLFTIMGGKLENPGAVDRAERMVGFLQRAIGYTLSGITSEEILLLCIGTGGNGKSKMIETVLTMMGTYGQTASFDTFLEQRGANGGGAQENILKLMGARFVKASEPDAGKRLNTAIIKDLTGGETQTARGLYEKRSINFMPAFTLWLSANHKPEVKGQDRGIWRRIKLIPFNVTFANDGELKDDTIGQISPETILKKDPTMGRRLKEELPGILAWAVQGCLAWQKNGLEPPQEVELATKEYKEENDILGDFFNERCVRGRGQSVPYGDMYRAYANYCEDEGQPPIKKKAFRSSLEERGFHFSVGHGNVLTVHGVGILK